MLIERGAEHVRSEYYRQASLVPSDEHLMREIRAITKTDSEREVDQNHQVDTFLDQAQTLYTEELK